MLSSQTSTWLFYLFSNDIMSLTWPCYLFLERMSSLSLIPSMA
jgi:hypothetical protein